MQQDQAMALEAQRQRVLAAERESADVGIVALRTAILVNAGAVVALLAFIGQLWSSRNAVLAAVLGYVHWFFWGLVAAVAASVVAYCFVEMKSAREDRRYFAMLKGEDALPLGDPDSPARLGEWLAVLVGALVLGAYASFAIGAWRVLAALAGS
jgi:hypothetical protein